MIFINNLVRHVTNCVASQHKKLVINFSYLLVSISEQNEHSSLLTLEMKYPIVVWKVSYSIINFYPYNFIFLVYKLV